MYEENETCFKSENAEKTNKCIEERKWKDGKMMSNEFRLSPLQVSFQSCGGRGRELTTIPQFYVTNKKNITVLKHTYTKRDSFITTK